MATTLPELPPPPPPSIQRFTPDGRPTEWQVTYETQVREWMKAVKTWIEGQP